MENICGKVVLNLEEVRVVDRAAVRFPGSLESNGLKLLNCHLST